MKALRKGDRVRMSEALKTRLRGRCVGGQHVQEPMAPFDGECMSCSAAHLEEFGDCVGVVDGPTDFNNRKPGDPDYDPEKVGPCVDVRWQPSNLRYMYDPDELELVTPGEDGNENRRATPRCESSSDAGSPRID